MDPGVCEICPICLAAAAVSSANVCSRLGANNVAKFVVSILFPVSDVPMIIIKEKISMLKVENMMFKLYKNEIILTFIQKFNITYHPQLCDRLNSQIQVQEIEEEQIKCPD